MNDYQINDFGKACFVAKTGWKYKTTCYGRITAIERNVVEFTDNDDNIYLIYKKDFEFIREPFNPEL